MEQWLDVCLAHVYIGKIIKSISATDLPVLLNRSCSHGLLTVIYQ